MSLPSFRGLAIEGGGVAGIALIGALERWVKEGLDFNQFTHFAGSSVGSMVATMLAIRAPIDYIENKLKSTDFSSLLDTSFLSEIEDAYSFWKMYGWHPGTELENWYAKVIEEVTGNRDMTMAQAHEKYKTHLIITKTDVLYPECNLVTMDYRSHPNLTLHEVVRTSCSIPFFFQAMSGKDKEAGHMFVDGGVLLNYPLKLLYPHVPKEHCMGLYFTTTTNANTVSRPIASHKEFIVSLISSWKKAMMGEYVRSDDWSRTCAIPVDIGATDFSISKEKQEAAIKQGWEAMDMFISSHKN